MDDESPTWNEVVVFGLGSLAVVGLLGWLLCSMLPWLGAVLLFIAGVLGFIAVAAIALIALAMFVFITYETVKKVLK